MKIERLNKEEETQLRERYGIDDSQIRDIDKFLEKDYDNLNNLFGELNNKFSTLTNRQRSFIAYIIGNAMNYKSSYNLQLEIDNSPNVNYRFYIFTNFIAGAVTKIREYDDVN